MRYQRSLDLSTRRIVCGLIARYDSYVQSLAEARREILLGSPKPSEKVQSSDTSDTTQAKAERLVSLDMSFKSMAVKAVNEAKELLAVDLEDEAMRKKIVLAIWQSCISPRSYPYRSQLWISRSDFYRRRNDFLCDIANNLGLR